MSTLHSSFSSALTQQHLFVLHLIEAHLQRAVCIISSGAIFIPVESIVGLSHFSPSVLSQPYLHGFNLGGLPLTQFFHMTSIQCACLMFLSRASLVGGILLLVLLSIFLHGHSCFLRIVHLFSEKLYWFWPICFPPSRITCSVLASTSPGSFKGTLLPAFRVIDLLWPNILSTELHSDNACRAIKDGVSFPTWYRFSYWMH